MNPILEVRGLSKDYGDLPVLRDITFSVNQGDSFAVLGPSGCGKSTLLRIILGLEGYDAGEVRGPVDRAGYLPQDSLLFPWKTVVQNAELPLQIRGIGRKERREEVLGRLESFGLARFKDAYPHELSGGMRQRAGLLRATVSGAEVLVLDEPFGALDTLTRHRLQDWLSRLLADLDRTMLFVTHDLEEAVVLADRVLVLSDRPATVIGERGISLSGKERSDRLSGPFYREKDALLAMIQKGDESGG